MPPGCAIMEARAGGGQARFRCAHPPPFYFRPDPRVFLQKPIYQWLYSVRCAVALVRVILMVLRCCSMSYMTASRHRGTRPHPHQLLRKDTSLERSAARLVV
jgi:hypothetical protein